MRVDPAAYWLDKCIFGCLLFILACAAVPYGTVEPWWEGLFECAIFGLTGLWLVHGYLSGSWRVRGVELLLPLFAMVAYSFCQTISLKSHSHVMQITGAKMWDTISYDPYETRRFAVKLLALALAGGLLLRFATGRRVKILINLIIGIAVTSALFGMIRQTAQHESGFVLPFLAKNRGYAQFINKNHFAFLMEMGFGLAVGVILCGEVSRDRVLLYCAALLPIFTALILSNSRGGILSMAGQLIFTVIMLPRARPLLGVERKSTGQGWISRFAQSLLIRVVLTVTLVAGLGAGVVWIGGDPLIENFQAARGQLGDREVASREGERRTEIWSATWSMTRANLIAGVGMGAFWAAIPRYHDASGRVTPQQAHNDYLELMASGGIIGLAIGAWFLFELVRHVRRSVNAGPERMRAVTTGALIGISGVAIHSVFDFGLHVTFIAVVFMSLLVMTVPQTAQSPLRIEA